MALFPKIKSNLEFTERRQHLELRHPTHRTVLQLSPTQMRCVRKMDGEHDLEELETVFSNSNDMSYPMLLKLLHALWDRGMLEGGESIQEALFPADTPRTLNLSQARRKLYWLLTGFWGVRTGPIQYQDRLNQVLNNPLLAATLSVCAIISLFVVTPKPQTTMEWLDKTPLVYVLTCLLLSLSQFLQASCLAGDGSKFRLGMRNITGFFCFDFSEARLFSSPLTFAPINIVLTIGVLSLLVVLYTGHNTLWMATEIFLLIALCPFLPTAGAYTLEQLLKVPKQRYRISSFFTAHLGQSLFRKGHLDQEWRYGLTACVWILWFYAAIHTVGLWLRTHHIELLFASFEGSYGASAMLVIFTLSILVIVYVAFIPIRILFKAFYRLLPTDGPQTITPYPKVSEAIKDDILSCYSSSLLASLTSEEFLKGSTLRTYKSNQWIYPHKDPGVMLIVSGRLQRQRYTMEGHYQSVGYADAGWVLGMSEDTDASRCIEPVQILHWPIAARQTLRQQNHSNARQFVQSFSAFTLLNGDQIDAILHEAKWVDYATGTLVLEQDAAADKLILIQSGKYSVHRDSKQIATVDGYSIIGEAGVLSGRNRNATVRCDSVGRGLEVPAPLLYRLLQESTSTRRELSGLLATREVIS